MAVSFIYEVLLLCHKYWYHQIVNFCIGPKLVSIFGAFIPGYSAEIDKMHILPASTDIKDMQLKYRIVEFLLVVSFSCHIWQNYLKAICTVDLSVTRHLRD